VTVPSNMRREIFYRNPTDVPLVVMRAKTGMLILLVLEGGLAKVEFLEAGWKTHQRTRMPSCRSLPCTPG